MNMKRVFWRLVQEKSGSKTVEYWTKEDRSDSIKENFAVLNDQRLRERYTIITGRSRFELVEIKNEKK